jgi:hypothetical protein
MARRAPFMSALAKSATQASQQSGTFTPSCWSKIAERENRVNDKTRDARRCAGDFACDFMTVQKQASGNNSQQHLTSQRKRLQPILSSIQTRMFVEGSRETPQ